MRTCSLVVVFGVVVVILFMSCSFVFVVVVVTFKSLWTIDLEWM